MQKKIIHLIAAARPNFMKVAPIYHALAKEDWCHPVLVHTGQHYDTEMSDAFFDDLSLPKPECHLGIGSGTHAEQTGKVMIAYEKLCMKCQPLWVIVVGDVNSTMACAITAKKLQIPVAHLEAGLRSFDQTMPEEINRKVTDAIADLLWTPSCDGDENLIKEGVDENKIERVGNIMIDSFEMLRSRIEEEKSFQKFKLIPREYSVVTFHRPSNVDDKENLNDLVNSLIDISSKLPLVFPVHPRTRKRLEEFELLEKLNKSDNIHLTQPLSYIPFMSLVIESRIIITDSGGVQEETSYLGIPCLTLRNNTERPVTVIEGTNKLTTAEKLLQDVVSMLSITASNKPEIDLWDGNTAFRVVLSLKRNSDFL